MAMMDNIDFLIAHIRHSFITSDDTSMCELIMECESSNNNNNNTQRAGYRGSTGAYLKRDMSDSGGSEGVEGMDSGDGDFLSHSHDILPDMDYGAHRRRSNTAQRLDIMRKDKQAKGKVKSIPWKDAPVTLTVEERASLFEKKEVAVITPDGDATEGETPKKVSKLSKLLEDFSKYGENPYMEYAKFDGRSCVTPTKKIDIFLTMAPPKERAYPMTVVVITTAKVQDLIGLICWQYTCEGREPKLQHGVNHYCLHIAEDDGEVDADFPSLDNREPVLKFGFGKLALVECTPTIIPKHSFVVTINVPNRGFNKFQVDSLNMPMRSILEKVINRRKIRTRPGLYYNLEKQSEPGVSIDLDANLAHMDTMEFCMVRENSTRGDREEAPHHNELSHVADSLTSHQYKSFMVMMVHRLRANTEVQLGVSGEKVEIDPVQVRSSIRLIRQKPVTHEADSIADCDLLEKKSNGRGVFRLTYLTEHNYKHHDFEADVGVAMEIVQKLKNILELRLSPARKEFITTQDRKLRKRDSLKYSI
ncbi:target of rapamycin complex 2 subunit MAPKAP1-like [Littorina saxatilis]|uniref:Target of rapamycin complex 2 subunit MAPKAP1 n=1 Tax=Littorina saxatilis TaxID=31220 RepID=A0AAN9G4H2_9CAEN